MKWRICYLFFSLIFATFCAAQRNPLQHRLQLKVVIHDYNSLDPVYRAATNRFLHPDAVNYAAELGYSLQVNPSFSFALPLRTGALDAHHSRLDPTDSLCSITPCEKRYFKNEFFVGGDLLARFHLANGYILHEAALIRPYVFAGFGALYMEERTSRLDLQAPLGLGLNIQLKPQIALQAQFEYRPSLLINKNNLAISLGINFLLNHASPTPAPVPDEPPISDRDMNGLPNSKDDCPELAGPVSNQGCLEEILAEDKTLLKEAARQVNFETGNAVLLGSLKLMLNQVAAVMKRYPQHQVEFILFK